MKCLALTGGRYAEALGAGNFAYALMTRCGLTPRTDFVSFEQMETMLRDLGANMADWRQVASWRPAPVDTGTKVGGYSASGGPGYYMTQAMQSLKLPVGVAKGEIPIVLVRKQAPEYTSYSLIPLVDDKFVQREGLLTGEKAGLSEAMVRRFSTIKKLVFDDMALKPAAAPPLVLPQGRSLLHVIVCESLNGALFRLVSNGPGMLSDMTLWQGTRIPHYYNKNAEAALFAHGLYSGHRRLFEKYLAATERKVSGDEFTNIVVGALGRELVTRLGSGGAASATAVEKLLVEKPVAASPSEGVDSARGDKAVPAWILELFVLKVKQQFISYRPDSTEYKVTWVTALSGIDGILEKFSRAYLAGVDACLREVRQIAADSSAAADFRNGAVMAVSKMLRGVMGVLGGSPPVWDALDISLKEVYVAEHQLK